jgi:putative membrane protein
MLKVRGTVSRVKLEKRNVRNFLIRLALNAIALLVIAKLVPGINVGAVSAVFAALVLGAVNAVVRPILIVLTLPVTILSLGLFLLVINAAMFGLAAWLVPGFVVHGFGAALVGSVLYSIAGWVTNHYIHEERPQLTGRHRPTTIEGQAYYDR